MKQYIGTKLIEAEPAYRVDGKLVQPCSWPIEAGAKTEEGYAVKYRDGYMSWSPKEVFEEAYRPTDAMSFGLAIEAAKKGMRIARRGWNGKGMFVYLVKGSEVPFENLRESAARFITAESTGLDAAHICPHFDMKAADGTIVVGWLASQTDMLADDWQIVE